MIAFLISVAVGIACIFIGIANRKGDISSIHSYHTQRISQEDVLPFGKKMGLALILIGVGVILFSLMGAVSVVTGVEAWLWAGMAILAVGLIVGITICIRTTAKSNKGIF